LLISSFDGNQLRLMVRISSARNNLNAALARDGA